MQDYHVHSYFSGDSQSRIEDIIEQSKKMGIEHLIITDHVDDMQTEFAKGDTIVNTEEYIQIMSKFSLPAGLEYSWDGKTPQSVQLRNFDFVILSYHCEFTRENGQIRYDIYLDDFEKIIAEVETFNVIGHLDFPRRYDEKYRKFNPDLYDRIKNLFKKLIYRGKGIELNMAAVSMYGEPNPDWEILQLYKDCGGDCITIGSDAHSADRVGKNISLGLKRLKEIGFDYLDVFEQGKWKKKKIK
ncbi:MAG: PHP domain-containing protein [Thermotogota bacterium]